MDGQINGVLYGRILRHIANEKVRRLAHPGLVLRRITADLIEKVLAKPCNLELSSPEDATELFEALEREATLVDRDPATGDLVHRTDVRELMLPMLRASQPDLVRSIHRRAVRYYRDVESLSARVEKLYHRLMLGQTKRTLDKHWDDTDITVHLELARAIDEYPLASRLYLGEKIDDLDLGEATRAEASNAQWSEAVEPRIRRRLARGQFEEALELLRDRRDPRGHSLLPRLEVEALERVGHLDEAVEVATETRKRAMVRGDRSLADALTLDLSRIHERRGDQYGAMVEIEPLIDEAVTLRDAVVASDGGDIDEAGLIQALVVLTTWLRIEADLDAASQRDRHELERATADLATAVGEHALSARPSLYRDIVAEVGHLVPDLVIDAAGQLGIAVDEEEDLVELAGVLNDWDAEISEAEGSNERLIQRKVAPTSDEDDQLLGWVTEADREEVGANVADLLKNYGQGDGVKSYIQRSFQKESREALDIVDEL